MNTDSNSQKTAMGGDLPGLYPWQRECLDIWFRRECRGIVNAVTGSGKTRLAVHAAMMLKSVLNGRGEELKIRVAVPKIFMLSHWRAAFLRENAASRTEIGLYCGAYKDVPDLPFMIYVLNSARYSLARHILADIRGGAHVLLIVDECHHLMGEKNAKILEFLPELGELSRYYHVLALSATAENIARDNRLSSALGGVLYRYGLSQALRDGVISDFILYPVGVSFLPEERDEYERLGLRLTRVLANVKNLSPVLRILSGPEFFSALETLAREKGRAGEMAGNALRLIHARKEMAHHAENRIQCACELVRRMPSDARIILFGERIASAQKIHGILRQTLPGQTALYHSGMGAETMKAALLRYQSGEARILVTCRALDEGLDIPQTDVGIVVSSTKTERQRVQRLGRVLRRNGSPLPAKLYYIYLEESGDDVIYLEQDFPFPLVPISYDSGAGGFSNAGYEDMLERAAALTAGKNITPQEYGELKKNLALCLPRGDFALNAELCKTMIREADTVSKRNYWTSALLLARARSE